MDSGVQESIEYNRRFIKAMQKKLKDGSWRKMKAEEKRQFAEASLKQSSLIFDQFERLWSEYEKASNRIEQLERSLEEIDDVEML